jgi:predicted GNAT superfamily acetyltransferase
MPNTNEIFKEQKIKEVKRKRIGTIKVRRVDVADIEGIYNVAASVGKNKKESNDGFLMDNYSSNPKHYKDIFAAKAKKLRFFYVAEMRNEVVGFLMGYTRKEWLADNPDWFETTNWKPGFDMKKTDSFVFTDKIAIMADYTGLGIGSKIYNQYMKDLKEAGVDYIFSETIIDPMPNFASLNFRKKQNFKMAGMRYEKYNGVVYSDLIYYKPVKVRKTVAN